MTLEELRQGALAELIAWHESERPSDGREPERYVVCAGLAVLERMRASFPLERSDYITPRNQVRTSGTLIRNILARFGETRNYASEGGRTTRGTVPAAEQLVARLNRIQELGTLSQPERGELINELQGWLAERVKEFFSRSRIEVEVDLNKPGPQIVGDILAAAGAKAGAVAQHLVGAKLALRYPHLPVDNHSYTTADQQLGRPGDFVITDTAFHVTMSPMPPVVDKCAENLRNGYRAVLLVPDSRTQAARQMAEALEIQSRAWIASIESFVGQNVEELGEFRKSSLAGGIRALLDKYNERVAAAEADRSFLIEIPANL